ncbi:ribosomal protection-like ABC-F family protein [Butyrivibrio sp. XPD2006]|uniref:ribosomal protection-like ABC-F family protein n=1 Tax=Butyrivibrio sp. XPD2006 TaxID=1280668 RepID=UPI0003B7210D|nr:ABC-F type ribosomal protection protein [Butyrivibrio sp. XPD2006]
MSKKLLIEAENIEVTYGEQTVLNFERFYLYEGEKVGLVGINGAGKTTLLKVLSGSIEPTHGKVSQYCTPFYFEQFGDGLSYDDADYSEAGKLGVSDQLWQENVSGGENTRIRLSQLFSSQRAVAFLDEPTSNLDSAGVELLKKRLSEIETLVLISHDRALLNAVCDRIVEVSFGELNFFDGNYDDYLEQKALLKKSQYAEYENYQAEKKRLQGVYLQKKAKAKSVVKKPKNLTSSEAKAIALCGNRKPEDKARSLEKSAENVLKRIEHMEVKEKPKEEPVARPDFRLTNPPKNPIVIRGEHLTFGYGDKLIFDDADFIIKNGAKVALVGDNGAGKTTLIELIDKRDGVYVVPGAKIGYARQNMSQIDMDKTVLENVRDVSIQKESIARIILARLLLTERDIRKKASDLSGGERMKLSFAMLFVSDVNFLILDEPTNYLDIPSIEALEKLLMEYEGTLIFVSHDKTFVEHVATEKLLIQDGKITKSE